MNSKKVAGGLFWILVTALPVAGLLFAVFDPQTFTDTQDYWRNAIAVAGFWGPLLFILIQALQVIVTPISHYTIGAIGGFLYGPWIGGLLNWIGRIIGHIVAFFLARTIGRSIATRFVAPQTIEKYDRYVSDKSLVLFLFYFLPFFPDDEISYLAGLSKMKFRMFFLANVFGHIGGSLGLAYIGSGIDTRDPIFWVFFVSTLVGFPLVWYLLRRKKKEESSVQQNEAVG